MAPTGSLLLLKHHGIFVFFCRSQAFILFVGVKVVFDFRFIKLLKQFMGGFQLMMIVASVLCFIVGPISTPVDEQTIYLGVVLIFVVISTGFFTFYQEWKSDSAMASFKALTPSRCKVLRDGQVPPHSKYQKRHTCNFC
jgi:hypothetical protein